MLRSLYSGISGIRNFQTKLDVIGNNIANVNTAGFKKGRVTFKDAISQMMSGAAAPTEDRGGQNPIQVGLGSTISTIDTIHTGASLQTTGRSLDVAIDGDGYFIVRKGNNLYYTRAGNFYLDSDGTLVNSEGLKVQAYNNGVLNDITVNVNTVLPATVTDEIKLEGNFPSDAAGVVELFDQIEVVDENGQGHIIDVKFSYDGSWSISFINRNFEPEKVSQAYEINFPNPGNVSGYEIPIGEDADGSDIALLVNLNLEGLKNEPGSITAMAKPNGNTAGSIESYSIDPYGQISAVYSNGEIREMGRLAVAKFSNPSGLVKVGNNLFQESSNSGTPNINFAGSGRGTIASGALEMSNVDISEEFTEMIVAQRGFQANTRIITTSDEILQELVNLKR